MSSEAGPSSAPLFKKRGKSHTTRISSAAIHEPAASTSLTSADASTSTPNAAAQRSTNDDDEEEEEVSVQDLIALRSLTRKPTGIELQRLNKGDKKKKKPSSTDKKSAAQSQQERWEQQMQRGGLMATAEDEDSDEEDGTKPRRLVRKNNFQGETGTVDVDKHMMAYIEQEMQKRTGSSTTSTPLNSSEILRAVNNPEDELYAVAEKYQQLQRSLQPAQTQEQREGNVALSAAMLSAIPEVDLGIDTRMKNIEETERAKRQFFDQAKSSAGGEMTDTAFANARFQRQAPRTIRSDSQHSAGKGERKQMATDQLVLDRFKKRQRNFR